MVIVVPKEEEVVKDHKEIKVLEAQNQEVHKEVKVLKDTKVEITDHKEVRVVEVLKVLKVIKELPQQD